LAVLATGFGLWIYRVGIIDKTKMYEAEEKPSDNSVVSGQESKTNAPASKGEKKTKPKKIE